MLTTAPGLRVVAPSDPFDYVGLMNTALACVTVMTLVLSADHRVIDGALAARWMDVLVGGLEQPLRLLA